MITFRQKYSLQLHKTVNKEHRFIELKQFIELHNCRN